MPDKYSFAACEQYGRQLAARLCQQQFESDPEATLDGPALLKLTPVRQLNLLVLHQLLGRWQHDAEQLRSPYFDFEAEPVRAALGQFMNVLSRHISVGRAALEPLLAQAAATTLLLALDPAAAFERLLLPPDATPEVPAAYLQERLRYLDLGKPLFEGFVASLPAAPLGRATLVQRFAEYRAAHAQLLPAPASLLAELSALLPVAEADLQANEATPAPEAAPTPQHPAEALAEVRAKAAEPAATPEATAASQPEPAAPAPQPAAPEARSAAGAATPAEPAAPAPAPVVPTFVVPEAPAGVPLYEKLKAAQPAAAPLAATLRSTGHGTGTPSLAERSAPKVGNLREAISINQRYSFINELFNGENMDYHAAIAHLDELPNAEAAIAYVQQELSPRHGWGRKEEHVAKLLKLIERKFAPGA